MRNNDKTPSDTSTKQLVWPNGSTPILKQSHSKLPLHAVGRVVQASLGNPSGVSRLLGQQQRKAVLITRGLRCPKMLTRGL